MSAVPVYVNYAGTTSESFSIGKKGFKVLQGTGDPTGILAPVGSLYIRKDTNGLYQMGSSNNWVQYQNSSDVSNAISAATYRLSFTSENLANNVITISHNLGVDFPIAQLWSNGRKLVVPDDVQSVDANTITMDLSSFTVSGTWTAVISK